MLITATLFHLSFWKQRDQDQVLKKKKEIGIFKSTKQSLYGKQDSELPTQHQSRTKSQD